MKKNIIQVICFLSAIIWLISCQATPGDEVIVEKRPITEIAETVTEDKEKSIMPGDIPERWDEEIEKPESKIKIIFRAEIDAPEEAEIYVDKYEIGFFDNEILQKQLKGFLGDEYDKVKFLKWPNNVKQAYIDELISYKRGAEVDGRIVAPPEDDPYIKELEEYIAELPDDKDEYVEPVLDYDIPYDSSEYRKYKSRGKNYFSAKIVGGKYDDAWIYCHNYIPGEEVYSGIKVARGNSVIREEDLYDESKHLWIDKDQDIDVLKKGISNISLNMEEAAKIGDEFLNRLFQTDEYDIAYCSKALLYFGKDDFKGGYEIRYNNKSSDTAVLPLSGSEIAVDFINTVTNKYAVPMNLGYVIVDIFDDQVYSYQCSLKKKAETVQKNIGILPFNEVQERIKKIYSYNSVLDKVYGVDRAVVEVDKMILRMTYTRNEGDEVSIYSTPVWCVYGKYHMYKENGELYGTIDYNIMINAIDGSNMGH